MAIFRRLRKICVWAVSLALAVASGGAIAAYYYVTDSETLRDLIHREAPRFLPGCRVDVIRPRVRPFAGEVTLTHLSVRESDAAGGAPIARVPFVQVRYNPWAMTKGRFEPREVRIARPTLRLARRADGTWNLQGLLADPWPGPRGAALPPIKVEDGTVELADEGKKEGPPLAILREVAIDIPAATAAGSPVAFELSAKGDLFDRVHVEGTFDPSTGRVALAKGVLIRLNLSRSLQGRLPAAATSALDQVGLTAGEVDAELAMLSFDPSASPRLHYDATARLTRGHWKCPRLPFPISDVSVEVAARDGRPVAVTAGGSDGATSFSLAGKFDLDDPAGGPFEVRLGADELPLDNRLRGWTPPRFLELWELYFPEVGRSRSASAGRVNAVVRASRLAAGGEVGAEADVHLIDVSMKYRHFPYPVDHIRGDIHATPRRMDLKVETLVGNKPLKLSGTVTDPGPRAVAELDFDVAALPIDAALFEALPADVRKVVRDFRPTGSVRGHAHLRRDPPEKPGDDPKGRVRIDSTVDLNPDCSVTWEGLKYPVRNLTGRLEIHPDLWIFSEMRGNNGQAAIEAGGRVRKVGRDPVNGQDLIKVDMDLTARNLPFDQQLRDALPKPWQLTWEILNPTGASDIKATIHVEPGRKDRNRIEITPRKQTGVTLKFTPLPGPGGPPPAGPLEMRMGDVRGLFVYDTATEPPTTMTDVGFVFERAPVRFARGNVDVKDTGQFGLGVKGLEVSDLRLDAGVRKLMPPVMDQLARRLDDRPLKRITADLGLGWSGRAGESAWCRWEKALVVLSDNKVGIGTDLDLEHIQGQVAEVAGSFDGRTLAVGGKLDLDSINVLGQQITRLSAAVDVREGMAKLDDIRGSVLGGTLGGRLRATLDTTPRYSLAVSLKGADLHEFARSGPGHQPVKGLLSGWGEISGLGADPHTLAGGGEAHVTQGDLGHLPVALRLFNVLKLAKETKAAFDSANVKFRINNGETSLDTVQLFGNAFSLDGRGLVDVRGELDLKLKIIAGRDNLHVPVFSDLARELSGQILVVRANGPVTSPTFHADALPLTTKILQGRKRNPGARLAWPDAPWRAGPDPRAGGGPIAR